MFWILSLFVCALILSCACTPIVRRLALSYGLVDKPDNKRKLHKTPIARIGGIPLVIAYAGSLGMFVVFGANSSLPVQQSGRLVWNLFLSASLVFGIGLLDDLISLSPKTKLSVEVLAGLLAYFGGVQIHEFLWYPVPGYLGMPLTIVWLVCCTNAFNLIDGLDGLASGIGLVATMTTLVAGLLQGDTGLVIATAPLAGALLGFLLFNFNPATIFLGDGGSLWIGFLLAAYGVIWCDKSLTVMSITAPIMALAIPLLDTALSIVRRFLRKQPIFTPDRGHIHHRLLDRGLSPRKTSLLLYAAGGIGAGLALLQSGSLVIRCLTLVLFCGLVWAGIRYLGYREFALAANLLKRKTLRSMLQSDYSLQSYEESLAAAENLEACWLILRQIALEFHFTYVELSCGAAKFEEKLSPCLADQWMVQIPVSAAEYVIFKYEFETAPGVLAVAPLANVLRRSLAGKLSRLKVASQTTMPSLSEASYAKDMHAAVKTLSASTS